MLFLQLLLQDGGLHADVNGDGVLDHVQVQIVYNVENLRIVYGH